MRYLPIDNQLFITNRQRLTQLLKPKSLVVLNANDIMPTNADGTMTFRQNNDLFYLSGVDQEETRLVLFPEHPDPKFREVLFLRETSELIEIWEGHKLTKAEAEQVTGIPQKQIYWMNQFETSFYPAGVRSRLCVPEHQRTYPGGHGCANPGCPVRRMNSGRSTHSTGWNGWLRSCISCGP